MIINKKINRLFDDKVRRLESFQQLAKGDDMNYKHRRVVQFINENYDDLQNKRIIEAGGAFTPILSNVNAKEKVSMEINPDRIIEHVDVTNIVGDIQEGIPFPDDYFDICIFSEVLEHLTRPHDAIREIFRVSQDVIVTTPNNSLLRKVLRRLILREEPDFIATRQQDNMFPGEGHIKEYSWKEVINLFKEHDYELRKFEAIGCIIPPLKVEMFPRFSAKVLMIFRRS